MPNQFITEPQADLTAAVRKSLARYGAPGETLNPPALSAAPDRAKRATVDGYSLTRSGVLTTADDIINGARRPGCATTCAAAAWSSWPTCSA